MAKQTWLPIEPIQEMQSLQNPAMPIKYSFVKGNLACTLLLLMN